MSKKTAIEWLINELDYETISKFDKKLLQAKEMEKEQIIDAHNNGYGSGYMDEGISPEEFYNETYGDNK